MVDREIEDKHGEVNLQPILLPQQFADTKERNLGPSRFNQPLSLSFFIPTSG